MTTQIKLWLIGIYATIGFLFAIYQHFWGYYNYKSFAYNLGQGIVWPAVMFPSVGKIIGALLILGMVTLLSLRTGR
ncbi:MAG: hypothetical protein EOO69_08965 [Moraxellaceae bacterium]|nr:MAG: hypothetical protein EOO69_08965 [Moraxellaceae bacterium]